MNAAASALVHLYPPSWRRRYAAEFAALLDDTGVRLRDVVDIVAAAGAAWMRPPTHLHGRDARLRTTVSVTLFAWVGLAAGTVLFGKLTEHTDHGALFYRGYQAGAMLSTLAMAIGGVPLAVDIARRTRRHVVLLSTPLLAVLGFAIVLSAIDVLVPRSTRPGVGIGVAWFTTLVVVGLVAGLLAATGPALAVHRGRAAPRMLAVAVVAGTCATATMVASVLAALGFVLARNGGGAFPTGYAVAMAALVTIAATSCRRGMRAAVESEGDAGARS